MFCILSKPEFIQLFYFYLFSQGQFWWLTKSGKWRKNIYFTPWENSWHLWTPPLDFLWNEWAQKFHFDDVLLRRSEVLLIGRANLSLRVVPRSSSGVVERAKRKRVKITPREKGETPSVTFSRLGWFSRALAFRWLYYPWGQMGNYS